MKRPKSFDIFSSYNYYIPGIGGMFALLGMFLVGTVLGSIVSLILMKLIPGMDQLYTLLVAYPIQFIPPMLYAAMQSRKNAFFDAGYAVDSNNFGRFSGFSIALAVAIATLALSFVLDWVSGLMPPMPESLEALFENMVGGPLWASLLSVSVFAPFFEEWLCRGMIQRGLMQKMHPAWAIVISALFFALIHGNPWQAVPAFAMGLLFGYVYWRTGSLKLTMLMHCVNNTLAAVMGHIDAFKDIDSFKEVFAPVTYYSMLALCALMVVYFVVRLQAAVALPFGQNNACQRINDETDIA